MESIFKAREDPSLQDELLCMLQCVENYQWQNSAAKFRAPSTSRRENKELAIHLLRELLAGIETKSPKTVAAKGFDAFAEVKWSTTRARLFLGIRSVHSGVEVALMIDQLKSTLLGRKKSSDNERAKQVRALIGMNFLRLFSIEPAWISFARFERLSAGQPL
ncbi:MAG TPA: hypothetical protein VN678_10060 [Acidobacteriaceae bacterium]|nr:hypothetical protein [Acidobacteriaceae bacterium]